MWVLNLLAVVGLGSIYSLEAMADIKYVMTSIIDPLYLAS